LGVLGHYVIDLIEGAKLVEPHRKCDHKKYDQYKFGIEVIWHDKEFELKLDDGSQSNRFKY